MSRTILAVLIFIQVLFGINFVTSKVVVGSISPYWFACIRFFASGIFLWIYLKLSGFKYKGGDLKSWGQMALLALVGVAFSQTLFLTGLQHTTSINTSIISTTIPIFALIISWLRGQISINKKTILGFIFALVGVMLLKKIEDYSFNNTAFTGDIMILFACFFLAVFICYSKDFFMKHPPLWGTTYMFLFGGIYLIPFALNESVIFPPFSWESSFYPCIVFAILGGTLLTYFLNNWALTKVDPARVSLFINLQPVVASVLAWYWLGEFFGWRELLSIVLIVIGMRLALKNEQKKTSFSRGAKEAS